MGFCIKMIVESCDSNVLGLLDKDQSQLIIKSFCAVNLQLYGYRYCLFYQSLLSLPVINHFDHKETKSKDMEDYLEDERRPLFSKHSIYKLMVSYFPN